MPQVRELSQSFPGPGPDPLGPTERIRYASHDWEASIQAFHG